MIRKNLLCVAFAVIQISTFAQDGIVTTFFSKDGDVVSKEESYYYQVEKKKFSKIDSILTFYSVNDKVRSAIVVDKNGRANGHFSNYHKDGQLKSKGFNREGRLTGLITSYYPDGKVQAEESFETAETKAAWLDYKTVLVSYFDSTGNQLVKNGNGDCGCHFHSYAWDSSLESGKVVNGKKEGVWSGFDTKAEVSFKEIYKNGELINGESYDSLGIKYRYEVSEEPPIFETGLNGMLRTISTNLKLPADAREGKVLVGFFVDKDGSISDIKLIKGFWKSCDEEALRVARLLTTWTPGKRKGKIVRCKFALPIRYKLH